MVLLSLAFSSLASLCWGRLLSQVFPRIKMLASEQFVLGAGTLALGTFALTLPGIISLRLASFVMLILPVVFVVVSDFRSWHQVFLEQSAKRIGRAAIIFGVVLIPSCLILLQVPPLGDALGHWALIVKEMIFYDDLPRLDHSSASIFRSYPLLGPMLVVNGLTLYGEMQDGAGRVIMFLVSCMGSFYVYERLKMRFSTAASIMAATIVHFLVLFLGFRWYTGWSPEAPFAVVLLISSYRLLEVFSRQGPPGWSDMAILSLSLTILVSLRPDGVLFLPLIFLLGTILLLGSKADLVTKLTKLIISLLAPCIFFVVWQIYVRLNQFNIIKSIGGSVNSPVLVVQAMVQQFFAHYWLRLGPLAMGFLVTIVLALLMFKRLEREGRVLLLLISVPVYRLLLLVATYALTFSRGEAARAAAFDRYMLQTGFTMFFVLAFLALELLRTRWVSVEKRFIAHSAIVAVVILHVSIAFLQTMGVSFDDHRRIRELVAVLKENSQEISPMHILDQDGPDFLWGLVRYYAYPDIITRGPNTIGRPVSTSSHWYVNARRNETNIHNQVQYLDFLHKNKIRGILILDSDTELERIMETNLDPEKIYLFRVTQGGFECQWSINRPAFDAPEGVSLRGKVRAIIWDKLYQR